MSDEHSISDQNKKRLQEQASQQGKTVDELLDQLLTPVTKEPHLGIPFQTLLDYTTDTVALFDIDLRYLYVNAILAELLGHKPDDMIGKTDRELGMSEKQTTMLQRAWENVIQTKTGKIISFEFLTAQGLRIFESLLTPIYDNNKRLIYLLAINRDVTERHHTETSLQDIINQLTGMFLRYRLKSDGTDEIPFVSKGINEVYEVSVEDALADISIVWAKIHPDDLDGFTKSIQVSAQHLSKWQYQWRIKMNDGSIKWVSGLGTPRRLEDGSILWNTLILDITEQKQVEEALREREKTLSLALKAAQAGIWEWDIAGDNLKWDETIETMHWMDVGSFDGDFEKWRVLVHPEDIEDTENALQQALDGIRPYDTEMRVIHSDGQMRTILSQGIVLRDEDDTPIRMIGVALDITERYRAEAEARKERNLLRLLIDNIPDYIVVKDIHKRMVEVNEAVTKLIGLKRDQVIGKTASELFDPEVAQQYNQDDDAILNGAELIINEERKMIDADGNHLWGLVNKLPLKDQNGHITGLVAITRDVTERLEVEARQLEAERIRIEMQEQRKVIELKERFIATASHDFRTPLSVIQSSTSLLERYADQYTREQTLSKIQRIQAQVSHMTNLIDDVLTISKSHAHKINLIFSTIDLREFCHEIWSNTITLDGGSHLKELSFNATIDQFTGDPRLLRQSFDNLLNNALKYTPEGKLIQCEVSNDDKFLTFSITDQGYGIPEEDLDHLFEPFHRARNVTNIKGTGLGLAIVKDFIELHDGNIQVLSKEGEGTIFVVQIPISQD